MRGLTRRQRAVLELVARHRDTSGVPAASVLAAELGLAGESSVRPVIGALEAKGYLTVRGGVRGRQRTIDLTPKARVELGRPGLPVLAGPAAPPGSPARLVERLDDLLDYEEGDFFLAVEDESMANGGILPGDLVLLRPVETPCQGEIAAVVLDADRRPVLRRVRLDPRRGLIRLEASNPAYADVVALADDVRVLGVFRSLVRGSRAPG